LTKLIFGGDKWHNGHKWATAEPATLEVEMAEADFGNKRVGAAGAIIVAAWISHKDNGALSVLNLASNNLGELVLPQGWTKVIKADWSVEYTHTDGTKQDQHPGKPAGIIALASAIPDMGALTSLNLASNSIGGYTDDDFNKFIATPEGISSRTQSYLHTLRAPPFSLIAIAVDIRSCCYR
jgi:hypothetical protein